MIDRRQFLNYTVSSGLTLSGLSLAAGTQFLSAASASADIPYPGDYELGQTVSTKLFDGTKCWCHPRAGIVPGAGNDGKPRAVMTMNTLDLIGSDVFKGIYSQRSDDMSQTWTTPEPIKTLSPRYENIGGEKRPVAVSDFWPRWHQKTKTLLGTGHTVVYTTDWKVRRPRPRHTSYAVYNPANDQWGEWQQLEMPAGDTFYDSGAGCVQRYDLPNGEILLPIYYHPPKMNSQVTVLRCSFDGKTLRYLEQGNQMGVANKTRGLHEPSLTHFNGEYFLTIRNDKLGYITRSKDGLNYEPIKPWTFDDGQPLGNYNTQQHWVTHSDGLFLVYTRRGANNDHVFRHRAPLFMAQVNPKTLQVIRKTERILVKERGARLGNFGVTDVSPDETWVTVSEWMQPKGVEKHGSDGSVYVARINWSKPNALFES